MSDTVWVGWCWEPAYGEWISVCSDRDLRACQQELIRWAAVEGVPMKRCVLTQGGKPTGKPGE